MKRAIRNSLLTIGLSGVVSSLLIFNITTDKSPLQVAWFALCLAFLFISLVMFITKRSNYEDTEH